MVADIAQSEQPKDIECYVHGCHNFAEGQLELMVGNGDTFIIVLLCKRDYRKAWNTKQPGWFGGSGVD